MNMEPTQPSDVPDHILGQNPEFESVLAASAEIHRLFPEAVLVGGTAAAYHARHRVSLDNDHVIADLRDRYDSVLNRLEAFGNWTTRRVKPPVLILGDFQGVETGIRQLIRSRPLETELVTWAGYELQVPTLDEVLRTKAWMILVRNATRDYLDVAALADRLEIVEAGRVLSHLDDYYESANGPVVTQLIKQLAEPAPRDLGTTDLTAYKGLVPDWQDWSAITAVLGAVAQEIAEPSS